MKSTEAALQREADDLLRRAEETDEEEDRRHGKDQRGDDLPEELAYREGRLKKIREAMVVLKAEAKEQARAEGKDPRSAKPDDKAQRNFTDPESRIQKQGQNYIQGYNAQVAVDGHAQVIVSQHVTSMQPDVNELVPVVKRICRLLHAKPKQVLADAGYWSSERSRLWKRWARTHSLPLSGASTAIPCRPLHGADPPRGLTPKQQMARKLLKAPS